MPNPLPLKPYRGKDDETQSIYLLRSDGATFRNHLRSPSVSVEGINIDALVSSGALLSDPAVKPIQPLGKDGWKFR